MKSFKKFVEETAFRAKDMKVGDKFIEKGLGQKFTVKRVTPTMIYADSEDGKINLQIDRSENDNDGNNRTDSHAHYLKVNESVGQLVTITLVRKASNLTEMEKDMKDGWGERVRAKVEEVKKLSTSEYDKLCKNFFAHTPWLDGKGGTALPEHVVSVIEVQAPGRKTLYIDPEGFDYARYVGY